MTKTLKFIICAAIAILAGAATSCSDYQDELDALRDRFNRIDTLTSKLNKNTETLTQLVEVMQKGDVITKVDTLYNTDGNTIKGFKIFFLKHDPIEVLNGKNGNDGETPLFTLGEMNGRYYWMVYGEFIKDQNGNYIPAVGEDGKTVTPRLRIDVYNHWQVSYDDGQTWTDLTDKDNKPITAKGEDGRSAENTFREVNIAYAGDGVTPIGWTFTMNNGQSFTIFTVSATKLQIQRNDNSSTSTVKANDPISLDAVITPANANYVNVYWFVKEGNASNVTISAPYGKSTTVNFSAPGNYVIGCILLLTEYQKEPIAPATLVVTVN